MIQVGSSQIHFGKYQEQMDHIKAAKFQCNFNFENISHFGIFTYLRLQQVAVAHGFEREYELFGTPESYFQQLPVMLHLKRNKLALCLESVGLQPIVPEGGYFMIVDISSVSK